MQVQRTRAAKITVSGFVQGVGYRYFALDTANVLGVKGYVRNLAGGLVEVFAEAEEDTLKDFVERLRTGPYSATVEDVKVEFAEATNGYSGFSIKH